VLKKLFLISALLWSGVILFFCLENSNNIPQIDILYLDKVIHAIFHFVFTMLWFSYLKKKLNSLNNFKPLVLAFVFSFVFGISIEVMQEILTTTRSADTYDILSNVSGSLLAVITMGLLNRNNKIIDET
jgi:glycopeptide antibiotics resistance protein